MIRGATEAFGRMRTHPGLAVIIVEAFLARLGFSVITFALPFYALSLGMSLGETGLLACPDWRATGVPRASLLASPAVWRGDTLIAAPLAGVNDAWQARIVADFHSSLVSH